MKTRILSAIVAFMIFIPIFLKGGIVFSLAFYIVGMIGLKEFLDVKEKRRKIPSFIKLIIYLLFTTVYFMGTINKEMILKMDFRILAGTFLVLLLPVVLYHDKKKYNVKDSFYLLGGILFLGSTFALFTMYRNLGLEIILFLFLITMLTDTFAYITGMLIGRHKLLEDVSPKKTWEGLLGGSILSTFVCTVYYTTVINANISLLLIILIIFFLTLIGQFGDLFFSAVKRYCGVKDFSNIMPGHGGILDRFDSIIFVMLAYTFFVTIL